MRLIDADALKEYIEKKFEEHYGDCVYQFIHDFFRFVIRQIQKAPTIEAEPVRHGRWEDHLVRDWHCSECGKKLAGHGWEGYYCDDLPSYCPNCGAKMGKED